MKKFVTLLLTAALAITAATTAFATNLNTEIKPGTDGKPTPSSGSLNVTYTVNPGYTVTIPTSVTLDSNTKSSTAKVKAENVTVPFGKSVKVALATDFKVKAGDSADAPTLNYQVTIPNSTTSVQSGATVLEVASDATGKQGETTLKFDITSDIVYSGTYTGTVTFTVSVGTKTT